MLTNAHQDPTHKFWFLKPGRLAKVSSQVGTITIILFFHLTVYSAAPSEDNRRGEESQNEQIRGTFLYFYLFFFFFTNGYLADKLTYKPCNGIDDLENENPAPDDLPSLSPHRLTKVQHGKAASAKAIAPPYISSPLRFPSSSPPAASRTVKPPSFIRGTQNPLPNATDQVRPGDDTGDR